MKRLYLIASGIFRTGGSFLRFALSTIGAIVALGFIALLFREVTSEQTVIEPISVPKSLADQGLTPEVAARRLQDAMNGLVLNALNSGGSKMQISYGKDLPEVVVPTVGISLSTLAAYVRMFLNLSSRSAVSGEIVTSDKNASLVLRLNAAEIPVRPIGRLGSPGRTMERGRGSGSAPYQPLSYRLVLVRHQAGCGGGARRLSDPLLSADG
jgi:hypothetical protein